jgi:preprotein translocase subunit YajC
VAMLEQFTLSDFEAFEESKWASHAFNRERLETKLKLTQLGKELGAELNRKLPDLEMCLTEERPSIFNQHRVDNLTLFFLRNEDSRRVLGVILDKTKSIAEHVNDPALHHRHINLAVRIRKDGLDAGLWLHKNAWVDWKNLVERCREYWERDNLKGLVSALPETIKYSCGTSLEEGDRAARMVTPEEIINEFTQMSPWTIFGETFGRSELMSEPSTLSNRLGELFSTLVPLYSFIAWRKDNDYHEIKEVLKQQEEKAQRRFSSLKPGDEVRILKGLASGRVGVIESLERKGIVKVRLGTMVISLKAEELGAI